MIRGLGVALAFGLFSTPVIAGPAVPKGVSAANLTVVWSQRDTVGPNRPLIRTAAAGRLPDGARRDGQQLVLRKPVDLSQWDFTGLTVIAEASPVTIRQSRFRAPGGHRLLEVGGNTPASVTIEDAEFDLAELTTLFSAGIQTNIGSNLTLRRVRLKNASMNFIQQFGNNLLVEDSFISAMGLRANPDAHLETIFVNRGKATLRHTLIDLSDGAGRIRGGITGALYFEGSYGPVEAELDGVVITGVKALGMLYTIQAASRANPVTITVRNSALERGSSGYIGISNGGVTIIDGGGNFDFASGKPVKLTKKH